MQLLPNENLFQILLPLPYEEILDKCRTSSQFNNICQDQHFWSEKLKRDFPLASKNPNLTAKTQYELFYKDNPCWIGNIVRGSFFWRDCIDQTIQQGNLIRLKQYLKHQSERGPLDTDYIYSLIRLAMKYHQWNIVQYFIPLLSLNSTFIINNLYNIGIELAQQGQYDLAKMALLRAINQKVRLAYNQNPHPMVIAALTQTGNEAILDWYINETRRNSNTVSSDLYGAYDTVAENAPTLDYLKKFMVKYNIYNTTDTIKTYLLSQIKQGHFDMIDKIKSQYPDVYNKYIQAINYVVTDTLARQFIDMIRNGKIDQVKLFIQQHPDVIPYAINDIYMFNLADSFCNSRVDESKEQWEERVNLSIDAISILFDLYPPSEELVDKFIKNILGSYTSTGVNKDILNKAVNLFVKYGYHDYNKIVNDTMTKTPYFAKKYANVISSDLLFEAGCYWLDLNMIQQSLTNEEGPGTESIEEGINFLFGNFYTSMKERSVSPTILKQILQDLLHYLHQYGSDIGFDAKDLSSIMTWIISSESIPDNYKIQLLNIIFSSTIFKSLKADIVIDWTEYYPTNISAPIEQLLKQQKIDIIK